MENNANNGDDRRDAIDELAIVQFYSAADVDEYIEMIARLPEVK